MMMAIARLNLPSVYLYGGTILRARTRARHHDPGRVRGRRRPRAGTIDDDELLGIERAACPTTGSCAGMYTANTMAAVGEAIGLSLPGAASPPAVDYRREVFARESGRRAAELVAAGGRSARHPHEGGVRERDHRRDGGRRLDERGAPPARDRPRGGVDLQLDDFDRISRRTPHLVDVRPAGRFVMSDLDAWAGCRS